MASKLITVSVPTKLAKELDEVRGDVSRSLFVRRLLETELGRSGE
jgi:metal-responsive CopG/Arc/MetJ family transcriptional regulator